MSTFVPKPNTGTLFNNDRKDPSSSQPDMRGSIYLDRALINEQLKDTPDGELVKFDISGWDNSGRIGLRFAKPYVKPERQADQKTQAAEPKPEPADDSDIPF